jgi:D-hydroxyproline dehydrogenase subunit gamma
MDSITRRRFAQPAPDVAPRHAAGFTIRVNGAEVQASSGISVAAALLNAGIACRTSVSGEPRSALCGMGICFECAATVDGVSLRRTCQVMCQPGMEIVTA